jgi:4'-phosphopantetheinyl transferase
MPSALAWPTATVPKKIYPAEIHLWAWGLDGPDPDPGALTASLDDEELERFRRFHFDRDRLRFAAAHANLRKILGAYLDRSPEDIRFETNPYGKPRILGESPSQVCPLYFNLSHSHSLALLALSLETEVGVDVEEIRPIEPEVAESHFSALELSRLRPLEGDSWLRGFYQCWTQKEAILKAEGAGLNLPLDAFDVSLGPESSAGLLATRPPLNFRCHWKLHTLMPAAGTIGALAAGNAHATLSCFSLPL